MGFLKLRHTKTSLPWNDLENSKTYQLSLIESLRDAHESEEYPNAALEEDDPELFLLALRNVAEAQGGVAQLAEKTNSIAKASTRRFPSAAIPNCEVSTSCCVH